MRQELGGQETKFYLVANLGLLKNGKTNDRIPKHGGS